MDDAGSFAENILAVISRVEKYAAASISCVNGNVWQLFPYQVAPAANRDRLSLRVREGLKYLPALTRALRLHGEHVFILRRHCD